MRVWRGLIGSLCAGVVVAGSVAADDKNAELLAQYTGNIDVENIIAFGAGPDSILAFAAIEAGRMILARELAEKLLAADPASVEGLCTLGVVLARAEGDLSGAAHYLGRCRDAFEARYGPPGDDNPWLWHQLAFRWHAQVLGDLERRDEAVEVATEYARIYRSDSRQDTAWWSYRAGRYDEARQQALGIIADAEEAEERATGWMVLCAVEADEGNLLAMYEACHTAVEEDLVDGTVGAVHYSNAAESARALLLVDEAEELLLEATEHFRENSTAIPWSDLTLSYIAQARLPEAADALREAQRWRRQQHAYAGALTWAHQDLIAAHLMLVVGREDVAAALSRRALERTDRYGSISTAQDERDGWANLLDRAIHRTLAQTYLEEASWSGWREAMNAYVNALKHWFRGWRAGRRFVASFADARLLESRLIPYAPGRAQMPEWLELDLVALIGPGVVEISLRRLDLEPPPEAASAYAMAFAAESARIDGRHARSLDLAKLTLEGLPRWEALLRARVTAGAAASSVELGDNDLAARFFDQVWQVDPGAIRRLGLTLPARFNATGGPAAFEALELLKDSPRFSRASSGFEVRVEAQGEALIGCLHGPDGTVLRCADARPGARSAVEQKPLPVQLARAFHERVFAPRVDLTQLDVRSLDGSTVVTGGDDARVRSVLDELLGRSQGAVPQE